MSLLSVHNLHASIGEKPILQGVDLSLSPGEIHFLIGPNGSGKSTLAHALMGSPTVRVTAGRILFQGEEITAIKPEERARHGLYLGFQYPSEVPGVPMEGFLRSVRLSRGETLPAAPEFRLELAAAARRLGLAEAVLDRNLNQGFSGGEKKRNEIFQLAVLKPRLAILDEFDSGLDVDGIRNACRALQEFLRQDPSRSLLVITHYGRIIEHLPPDRVHLMLGGQVVRSGGEELVHEVERVGFEQFS